MVSEILDKNEQRVLELEARRKIYSIVKKNAGCHFREIERRSRLSTGSVQYHLAYLAKHNLITEQKENNAVRYFPQNFEQKNKKLLTILRQKTMRHILLYVLLHTGCNHEQIVKQIQRSPSTISWHLKKLEEQRIISATKEGRKTSYALVIEKDEISKLLTTYQESFYDTIIDNIIDMWETE